MSKKKLIWTIISIIIAALTIWAITATNKNFSVEDFKAFVASSNNCWIVGALLCMFGFIWFEGRAILCILKSLGYRKRCHKGTLYAGADVYFSAITPSASGGQPASAFFMMRDGIPGPVVTVTLLTNLIMYTLALLSLGLFCIIFQFDVFLEFTTLSKLFIIIGIGVLTFLTIIFYLLLKKAKLLYGICDRFLVFLERIHLLKHAQRKRDKLNSTMEHYQECADAIYGKKWMLVKTYFWNLMQRISQFGVSFMVFMAQKQGLGKSLKILVTQCFVSLGSNCVPIPGSMGVADYLMIDGFRNIIGDAATNMELLCRSISFYGCIIVSGIIVAMSLFIHKIRGVRKC